LTNPNEFPICLRFELSSDLVFTLSETKIELEKEESTKLFVSFSPSSVGSFSSEIIISASLLIDEWMELIIKPLISQLNTPEKILELSEASEKLTALSKKVKTLRIPLQGKGLSLPLSVTDQADPRWTVFSSKPCSFSFEVFNQSPEEVQLRISTSDSSLVISPSKTSIKAFDHLSFNVYFNPPNTGDLFIEIYHNFDEDSIIR
jgi:hypothetical protein